jgi:hypothetical protein
MITVGDQLVGGGHMSHFSVPMDNAALYSQHLNVWVISTVEFEQRNHVKSYNQVF